VIAHVFSRPRVIAVLFLLAGLFGAGCGESVVDPSTFVRDAVTACAEHGGVTVANPDGPHQYPSVICQDQNAFVYSDGRLTAVDITPSVRP
jgi:hypothetical protein